MPSLERVISSTDWWGQDMSNQGQQTAEPIYDRHGRVVGWLYGHVIYDAEPQYRARLRGNAVYSFTARHLGHLDRGFFRDRAGFAVAFLSDAEGGLVLPRCEAASLPLSLPAPPTPLLPSQAPMQATSRSDWSPLTWDEFLRGHEG